MSINIAGYNFEGPHSSIVALYDLAGVYVILTKAVNSQYAVVDIGGSNTIKTRISSHDRQDCWKKNSQGSLSVAVLYTQRWADLEKTIRSKFSLCPCGER